MKRPWIMSLAAVLASAAAAPAIARQAAASPPPAYSEHSTIGELVDNPATRAILQKYVPNMLTDPRLDQGRSLPLDGVTEYVPELTPEVLAKINAELVKTPRK